MEILKFAEAPKRSTRSKNQKRGGLMPLLAIAVSVAVVGGMSTTLAGTISLNTGGSVEFGQGVVTTAACDTTIKILPSSEYETSTTTAGTFYVSQIELQDIGTNGGSDTATAGAGCLNKKLTLKAYNAAGEKLNMTTTSLTEIFVSVPDSVTVANTAGSYASSRFSTGVTILGAGGFGGSTGTNGSKATAGYITIGNLRIDGSVTKITIESSEV